MDKDSLYIPLVILIHCFGPAALTEMYIFITTQIHSEIWNDTSPSIWRLSDRNLFTFHVVYHPQFTLNLIFFSLMNINFMTWASSSFKFNQSYNWARVQCKDTSTKYLIYFQWFFCRILSVDFNSHMNYFNFYTNVNYSIDIITIKFQMPQLQTEPCDFMVLIYHLPVHQLHVHV